MIARLVRRWPCRAGPARPAGPSPSPPSSRRRPSATSTGCGSRRRPDRPVPRRLRRPRLPRPAATRGRSGPVADPGTSTSRWCGTATCGAAPAGRRTRPDGPYLTCDDRDWRSVRHRELVRSARTRRAGRRAPRPRRRGRRGQGRRPRPRRAGRPRARTDRGRRRSAAGDRRDHRDLGAVGRRRSSRSSRKRTSSLPT